MRQVGILAAAGLYALAHHVVRLKEDHHTAKQLALQLQQIPTVYVDPDLVETNIVVFEVVRTERDTKELLKQLKDRGVLLNAVGDRVFRAVTHYDVDAQDIEKAGQILSKVFAE